MVECENKEGVVALREISADRVRFKEDVADTMVVFIEEQRRQLRVTTGEHTFLEAASLRALEDDDDDDDDDDDGEVEELQSDPEALNKQASKNADDDDSDDSGDEIEGTNGETDGEDAEDVASDDEEPAGAE